MLSPGECIQALVEQRKAKNSHMSLRAIARIIGVSAPYLSRVISGQSKLSVERAKQIAEKLKLDQTEENFFLLSVAVHASGAHAKAVLLKNLQKLAAEESPFETYPSLPHEKGDGLFSEWYLPALLDLVTCSNFKPDPQWIATRMRLSLAEVSDGLDRLESLGLLDRKGPKWQKLDGALYCTTRESMSFVRKYHATMSRRAADVLDAETTPEHFEKRSMTSMMMAIDANKIKKAKKIIESFQDQLADMMTFGKCNDVYYLNVQFFPLTAGEEPAQEA